MGIARGASGAVNCNFVRPATESFWNFHPPAFVRQAILRFMIMLLAGQQLDQAYAVEAGGKVIGGAFQ